LASLLRIYDFRQVIRAERYDFINTYGLEVKKLCKQIKGNEMKTICTVFMIVSIIILFRGTCFANDLDGNVNRDIFCSPGSIHKNGKGLAIVRLQEGKYFVYMTGAGKMFLHGLQDYRGVLIEKRGNGELIWVPADTNKEFFAPIIHSLEGKGKIRIGSIKELDKSRQNKIISWMLDALDNIRNFMFPGIWAGEPDNEAKDEEFD